MSTVNVAIHSTELHILLQKMQFSTESPEYLARPCTSIADIVLNEKKVHRLVANVPT